MAWSRAFKKCKIFLFLDNFFCKHFYYITGFCDKKFNFCKFAIFFADSKSRAQELSNDVSFVIFGHKTWDLEGGGQIDPPQRILVFKYPSRDRVKSSITGNICRSCDTNCGKLIHKLGLRLSLKPGFKEY